MGILLQYCVLVIFSELMKFVMSTSCMYKIVEEIINHSVLYKDYSQGKDIMQPVFRPLLRNTACSWNYETMLLHDMMNV